MDSCLLKADLPGLDALVSSGSTEPAQACVHILNGRYLDVLSLPEVQEAMLCVLEKDSASCKQAEDARAAAVLENMKDMSAAALASCWCGAVAALHVFWQNNWTGPVVDAAVDIFAKLDCVTDRGACIDALGCDGEPFYRLADAPELLYIARTILVDGASAFEYETQAVWACRCLMTQQRLIRTTCASLRSKLLEFLPAVEEIVKTSENVSLKSRLLLEIGLFYHHFRRTSRATEQFEAAKTILGLEVSLSGALGKRTKFQVEEIAQLVVHAKSSHSTGNHTNKELLKEAVLDDDTLLPEIEFSESVENGSLSQEDVCVLLGLCLNVKNLNPRHGLTSEEMMPYVNRVLSQPRSWAVQVMGLLTKSRLEMERTRTIKRAVTQLEELVKEFRNDTPSVENRISELCCVDLPSHPAVRRELGERYLELGLFKEALDIFLELEAWTEIIQCYRRIGQTKRAEIIVRERLEQEETPELWVSLGEILEGDEAEECFTKAWALSNERYTEAPRAHGRMLLYKAEAEFEKENKERATELYEKCIELFQRCVALNSLQSGIWFSLGCAAQRVEKWSLASKAFRRKVEIDDDDFESWNNLARAYVMSNQKERAMLALQEAVKAEYENWKVWDNLSAVATDVGGFREAIHAATRVAELRLEYTDVKVFETLVHVVIENIPDKKGVPSSKYRSALDNLCSKVLEVSHKQPALLSACAKFYDYASESEKAQDCRRSAYQTAKAVSYWERDEGACGAVVTSVIDLADGALRVADKKALGSAKLALRSVIRAMAKAKDAGHGTEKLDEQIAKVTAKVEAVEATAASL